MPATVGNYSIIFPDNDILHTLLLPQSHPIIIDLDVTLHSSCSII